MLIEFRLRNHRCFAGEQVLQLTTQPKDRSLQGNTFSEGGFELVKSAVLYGPNATGKSALLQGLAFMARFVSSSASGRKPHDPVPVEPFLADSDCASAPSTFEATFILEGVRYQYGFSATRERVLEEWLLAYPHGRAQRWFERTQGEPWYFGPYLTGQKKRIAESTRPNALFLSTAASLNHEQLSAVYGWFSDRIRPILGTPGTYALEDMAPVTVQLCRQNPELRARVIRMLRRADLGIRDFRRVKVKIDEIPIPDELREVLGREFQKGELETVQFGHPAGDGEETLWLPFDKESRGTQGLFQLLGPWLDTLRSGYVLLVDEVFATLHPLLVREMIRTLHATPRPCQVLMTSHDTSLLEEGLFRRDQVWFTEKSQDQRATLYALLEYHPRKGEALQRGYLGGRYGAVPFVDFGEE